MLSPSRPIRTLALGVAFIAVSTLVLFGGIGNSSGEHAAPMPAQVLGASGARPATSEPAATRAAVDPDIVVRIEARGCGGRSVGSGVLLDGGRILTARHVLDGATSATVQVPGVGALPATVVAVDAGGRDAALLALRDADVITTSGAIDATLPASGAVVAAVGHPSGGLLARAEGAVIGSQTRGPLALDGGRVLTFDAVVEPGMSGGPVFDRFGHVVGVAVGFDRATRTGIAVPIGDIADLLDGEGAAPATHCGST